MSENPTTPGRPVWASHEGGPDPKIEHYSVPGTLSKRIRWASILRLKSGSFHVFRWSHGDYHDQEVLTAPTREEARKIAEDWVNRDPTLQ